MSKPAYLPSPGLVRAAGGRGGVEGVAHVAHGGADLPVAAAPAAAPEVVQVVRTVRRAEPGAIPCPMSDVPCPMRCRSAGSGEVRKRGSERSERSERSESTAPARRTTIANRTNQHAAAKKDQKEADKVPPPRTGSDPTPHPPTPPRGKHRANRRRQHGTQPCKPVRPPQCPIFFFPSKLPAYCGNPVTMLVPLRR